VLLFFPRLSPPPDGAKGVAAHIMQALQDDYDVTVLSKDERLDVAALNRFFGTSLDAARFRHREYYPLARRLLEAVPWDLRLLELHLRQRAGRHMSRKFDVVVSWNDYDLGRPTLQYVDYPHDFYPDLDADSFLYPQGPHDAWRRRPGLRHILQLYYALCVRLSGFDDFSNERFRRNRSLVPSLYSGELLRRRYGEVPFQVVHPPACGTFPEVAWEERQDGFATICRLDPFKRIDRMILLVERLRQRFERAELHIIATSWDAAYAHGIRDMAAHRPWVHLHMDVPRAHIVEVISRQRYGLHAAVEEPYGMGVAEMLLAGCIPFVHDSGGQIEIVGHEPALCYSDDEDALQKVERMMDDPALQRDMRARLRQRHDLHSAEHFRRTVRAVVDDLAGLSAR
jgi:glycosyltransferase involved in cell wall biosynthesis